MVTHVQMHTIQRESHPSAHALADGRHRRRPTISGLCAAADSTEQAVRSVSASLHCTLTGSRLTQPPINTVHLLCRPCRWVRDQPEAELWTDGVDDYLRYAKELVSDYGDVLNSAPAAEAAPAPTPGLGGFAFGAGSAPPAAGGLFGSLASTGAAAGGGAGAAPAFTGFNFAASAAGNGALGVAAGGQPATGAGGDAQEEEVAEEEPEPVGMPSADVDILSKHRVKLFSQKEGRLLNRGMGTLTLRRPSEASGAGARPAYLVFTTDTGRVLINAPLIKGLEPTPHPKDPALLSMVLISNVDGAEERGLHMLKCSGGASDASELAAHISSNLPQ